MNKIGIICFHSTSKVGRIIPLFTLPFWKTILRPRKIKEAYLNCATHIAVWFEDDHSSQVYYEALEGEGWQGAFPIEKALEWAEEVPERWIKQYDLTSLLALSQNAISRRVDFCEEMKKYWYYNIKQFVLFLRSAQMLKRFTPSSTMGVICSEAGGRICHSDVFDFREVCRKKHFDHLSPEDIHRACEMLESLAVKDTAGGA